MTAADLGSRVLGEIECESLSDILSLVNTELSRTTIQNKVFNHPALDACLDLFIESKTTYQDVLSNKIKPRKFECVEITSPGTCDGKTQFLYHIIASALVDVDSQNLVIMIDCDASFSTRRLVQVLYQSLRSSMNPGDAADLDLKVEDALQHIHIFSPQSMQSLIETIKQLPEYLFNQSLHKSMNRKAHSIIIDSATAFYWRDRQDCDIVKAMAGPNSNYDQPNYLTLKVVLYSLAKQLHCPIIYTTSNMFGLKIPTESIRELAPSLPRSWHTFPDLRLLVQRRTAHSLPPTTSADEAIRDSKERPEVIAKAMFKITINEYGKEDWSDRIREMLNNVGGIDVQMKITNEYTILV